MSTKKIQFLQRIQAEATSIIQAIEGIKTTTDIYFDRGYNSGGANELIDADIVGYDVVAADITNFITLAQQLDNFANNGAVSTGDYAANLNKLRTDA